jgi:hypothetical protein
MGEWFDTPEGKNLAFDNGKLQLHFSSNSTSHSQALYLVSAQSNSQDIGSSKYNAYLNIEDCTLAS